MKTNAFLKRALLFIVSICAVLGLSSCALSDDKFLTRDEIASYLDTTFPGKTYTLADSPRAIRGITGADREWAFTLEGYPGYTFHVYSRRGWGMIPFYYSHTTVSNDAYYVVAQDVLSEKAFYNDVLQKEYPELCDLWDQNEVDKITERNTAGFTLEDGSQHEFAITIPDITRVDDAQKLAGVVVNHMHEKAPELSELPFHVNVPVGDVDNLCYPTSIRYDTSERGVIIQESFAGRDWESIYDQDDDWGYYGERDWKQTLINGICKVSAYNGINVCGISDAEVQDWMKRVVVDGDDPYGEMNEYLTLKCIMLDGRYLLVGVMDDTTDSNDKGIYMTLGVARNYFEWRGLKVGGDRTEYRVTGVDGSIYEFSYSYREKESDGSVYYYYVKDGERYKWPKSLNPLLYEDMPMDDETIKQVSGVDLYKLLEPGKRISESA